MGVWSSKWLHEKATFGQLFDEDVQINNEVNFNNFLLSCISIGTYVTIAISWLVSGVAKSYLQHPLLKHRC
jgi:hypothetical protein